MAPCAIRILVHALCLLYSADGPAIGEDVPEPVDSSTRQPGNRATISA